MRPISAELPRYDSMHGWANRILRIDLSDMRIWAQEAAPYVPDYLGARGVAARIAWDEYPEPVGEFDPANPLMVMTGALTGSRSPYSGRTNVCAFRPQAYPYHWFTRSSIGGRFGGELKRSGYDGIVVTGASDTPVRVRIRGDEVSVLAADDLWGLDTMDTLEALEAVEGKGVRSLVIGPAGERLSRIATIQTASSSAAGQGGFGGVMGSKKLKAISVVGTGRVSLASPGAMTALTKVLVRRFREAELDKPFWVDDLDKLNRELKAEGGGRARCEPCTEGCLTPCAVRFQDMPGAAQKRTWSGSWFCIAWLFVGPQAWWPAEVRAVYDWRLVRRAGFEMNVLSNRYGLNQFDILVGVVPWLIACQKGGEIRDLNGRDIDWNRAETWAEFLHATAYREGLGDVLAEGGWAAAQICHARQDAANVQYAGWGHTGHWDGHAGIGPAFPYWLVSALQWMSDTRDPFNSGHGSLWAGGETYWRIGGLESGEAREAELDMIRAIGEHLYGHADAVDPFGGYRGKASMGHFHTLRPVIKDCVPVDDMRFPQIYDENAPDRYWRLDVDGIGEIEGPSIEYQLFRAGTGLEWSEDEFGRAAERVCTLERALQVRHWGRDRRTDEMLLPYFEGVDAVQSPFLDQRYGLDREQFKPVVDEFYALHGWDENGWPTRKALDDLGMADVYEPMVEGATRLQEGRSQSPAHEDVPGTR